MRYHSRFDFVSQSMLKVFLRSPEEYYRRFILTSDDPQFIAEREPTDAMNIGSIAHTLFLESGSVDDEFLVVDLLDRRGSAWKQAKLDALESGRIPILKSTISIAESIVNSARSNQHVRSFFDSLPDCEILVEQEIFWQGEFLPKKAKLDKIIVDKIARKVLIVELKTTINPARDEFVRQYWNMGYHIQAAWYSEAIASILGSKKKFTFEHVVVAVRNTEPYDAAFYHVSEDFVELGRKKIQVTEPRLAQCYSTANWTINSVQGTEILTPDIWMEKAV